jgi:hypothetical protein
VDKKNMGIYHNTYLLYGHPISEKQYQDAIMRQSLPASEIPVWKCERNHYYRLKQNDTPLRLNASLDDAEIRSGYIEMNEMILFMEKRKLQWPEVIIDNGSNPMIECDGTTSKWWIVQTEYSTYDISDPEYFQRHVFIHE